MPRSEYDSEMVCDACGDHWADDGRDACPQCNSFEIHIYYGETEEALGNDLDEGLS